MTDNRSSALKISLIVLLMAEIVTVTMPVIILGKYFNFPDILRQPAEKAFELFSAHQANITLGYYLFLISSLLYIPLSYALSHYFDREGNQQLPKLLIGLGMTTAIFQSIGFVRWIFVMPYLTATYFAQPESKETVTLIYEMLNRYAGMSIGEHLGFIVMGSWTIVLGILLVQCLDTKKWLGYVGCPIGLLLVLSVGEHAGGENANLFGTINFLANTLWTFWLMAISLIVLLNKKN